jgi:hypothetical protein
MIMGYDTWANGGEHRNMMVSAARGETTDAMIAALDAAMAREVGSLADALRAEDPRTWREVYDAGLVTDDDVARAYRAYPFGQ